MTDNDPRPIFLETTRNIIKKLCKMKEWDLGLTFPIYHNRTPLLEVDWFMPGRLLAIADVIYVNGTGICSHQPQIGKKTNGYRMMDVQGNVHIIKDPKRLYDTTREEIQEYWKHFKG